MRRHVHPRWIVAALLLVALVLRLGLVVATDPPLSGDSVDYDRHAVSLAQDARYPDSGLIPSGGPTAFRPPAYPVVLGAAYWVTGTADSEARIRVGRALGALLGLLAVVLVGAIARTLFDPRTGWSPSGWPPCTSRSSPSPTPCWPRRCSRCSSSRRSS
jgi:hypothetical protein